MGPVPQIIKRRPNDRPFSDSGVRLGDSKPLLTERHHPLSHVLRHGRAQEPCGDTDNEKSNADKNDRRFAFTQMQTHCQPVVQRIERHSENQRPQRQRQKRRKDLHREPYDSQQQEQAHVNLHQVVRQHLADDIEVFATHTAAPCAFSVTPRFTQSDEISG